MIIIGRDSGTARLRFTLDNDYKLFGNAGSVPQSVSHQHCKLEKDPSGGFTLYNLKPENVTFVNGVAIEKKHVTTEDRIELGPNRYKLDWSVLQQLMPVTIDLRPLKSVWDHYHDERIAFQIRERKLNAISRIGSIFTMAAVASGFLLSGHGKAVYYVLYFIAIAITAVSTIIAYINSSKIPKLMDDLDQRFKDNYVCPNTSCHHFMGYSPYDILSQSQECPYCRGKYEKK